MHVAGVEVVLLVPGGGRQHDVGIEAGRAHAEVERDDQVELAFGCLVVPDHFGRFRFVANAGPPQVGRPLGGGAQRIGGDLFAEVLALHAVRRAEQVLEEILVALAAGAQDVGAPDEHVARPVVGVVRVLAAHRERTVLQALDGVVLRLHAGGGGVAHHLQRIGLELRCRRQPAHALGAHVVVDHAAGVELLVGQGREHFFHAELLVAPLVGVGVEEARGVHLPRWADPVQRKGQRGPAGLRAQFLLAHVVRPAAAALADAAAHHQHVDDAAVVHVGVVPVVHGRADDDHRLALRLVGVVGELARHRDQLLARRAGDAFLPGRRVGRVVVEVLGRHLAGQAARDAVVGHLQVEHGGHERLALLAFLAQRDALHRHRAHQHVVAGVTRRVVREVLADDAAEVGKADLCRVAAGILAFHHRELELDVVAVARFLGLQVPLAFVGAAIRTPAETDGADR